MVCFMPMLKNCKNSGNYFSIKSFQDTFVEIFDNEGQNSRTCHRAFL